jgi:hypothetical protein
LLNRFRQGKSTAVIAQWLVALFLFQAMLPVQAHSRMQRDSHGITVVICTLQGQVSRSVDLPGHSVQKKHPASAAMQFSNLLNHTTPLLAILPPPTFVTLHAVSVADTLPAAAVYYPIEASSRAPPRV